MKSEITYKKEPTSKPFPKLLIALNSREIIIVTKDEGFYLSGVVIHSKTEDRIGYTSDTWVKSCFEDFHGSVTLTED